MMYTFSIPYPAEKKAKSAWNNEYGLNAYYSGKAWQRRKKDAEFWHWQTIAAAKGCRLCQNPVRISFGFNDRMDIDNHAVIAKMIIDGLKGKVITDDSRRYVQAVEMHFHDEDYIEVVIEDV